MAGASRLAESHCRGHRFPPQLIGQAVWLYRRVTLSFRDIEDFLADHGVIVPYQAVRLGCRRFGPTLPRKLHRRQDQLRDVWHVDEVVFTIRGQRRHLRKVVDQDSDG